MSANDGGLLSAVGDDRRERMLDVLEDDAVDVDALETGDTVRVVYAAAHADGDPASFCARVCGVCADSVHMLEPTHDGREGRALRLDLDTGDAWTVQSSYSDATDYRRTPDGGHAVESEPNARLGSVMFALPADLADKFAERHTPRRDFENRPWLFAQNRTGCYLNRPAPRHLTPGLLVDRLFAEGGDECRPTFDLDGARRGINGRPARVYHSDAGHRVTYAEALMWVHETQDGGAA